MIEAVLDPVQRDLLRYRYLNGWSWGKIAQRMNYTREYLLRLHGHALASVRVPPNAEPVEESVRRALRKNLPKGKRGY